MTIHSNPFRHELNYYGTACAEDCPARRWVSEQTLWFKIKDFIRRLLRQSENR
jgi:hypothetical protein